LCIAIFFLPYKETKITFALCKIGRKEMEGHFILNSFFLIEKFYTFVV